MNKLSQSLKNALAHIAECGGATTVITMDYPHRTMNTLAKRGYVVIEAQSTTRGQWRWSRVQLTDAGRAVAFDSGAVYEFPALPTIADVQEMLERPYPTVVTADGMGQHRNKGMLAAFFATLSLVED